MPDGLTADERAAIDAALAEGRVTRVPTGVCRDDMEYRWDGKNLAAVDPEKARAQYAASMRNIAGDRRKKGPDPKVAARREQVREMNAAGMTAAEVAERLGVSESTIHTDAHRLGVSFRRNAPPPPVKAPDPAIEQRRDRVAALAAEGLTMRLAAEQLGVSVATIISDARLRGVAFNGRKARKPSAGVTRAKVCDLHAKGMTANEIAAALGKSTACIYQHAKAGGLAWPDRAPRRSAVLDGEGATSGDRAVALKAERAAVKVGQVKDRRRFKQVPVPMGRPSREVPPDTAGTIFPNRVHDVVDHEAVLIDGANNSKIGGDVLVGRLKGARIFTLTLEERATCPRSCALWRGCYGNSMQWSRRWRHGPALERALDLEIGDLCAVHPLVLIRLHVLGDFYSTGYVDHWGDMLDRYAGLHVFGFTAWGPDSEIGGAVAGLRSRLPGRFMVRHSERTGHMGAFTLPFPTEAKRIGDAVVCPEQRDGMEGARRGIHCGSCAVCWQTDLPIAFVQH